MTSRFNLTNQQVEDAPFGSVTTENINFQFCNDREYLSFKTNNKRFPQFVNRLKGFIERTIDHYLDAKDFILADAEDF